MNKTSLIKLDNYASRSMIILANGGQKNQIIPKIDWGDGTSTQKCVLCKIDVNARMC